MKSFGAKVASFVKTNYKILLLIFSFIIVNFLFLILSFKSSGYAFRSKRFIFITIIFLIVSILFSVILFVAKAKKWKIEKIFLFVGSLLGLFYLVAVPIGRVPDEYSHFHRSYGITMGCFVSQTENGESGCYLPENINELVWNDYTKSAYSDINNVATETPNEELEFIHSSADGYSPISYIPQTLGIFFGRILNLPMIFIAYLGRLFNLIFCIAIIYFSLKYIPFCKKPLFLIACLPITMQSFASVSADGVVTCSAIALISFVLYMTYGKEKTVLKWWHYLLMFALCLLATAAKPIYAPLCLLLFWIPKERFGSKKNKLLSIFAIGFVVLTILLCWLLFIAPPVAGNVGDTKGQLEFIMSNPLEYFMILFRHLTVSPVGYLNMTFGGSLEWLDVILNPTYIIATFVLFILLCLEEKSKVVISKSLKIFAIIATVVIVIALFTYFYIQWSAVGTLNMEGVQGRYFLPFLLLVPLGCASVTKLSKSKIKFSVNDVVLYAFVIFLNIHGLMTIMCYHI